MFVSHKSQPWDIFVTFSVSCAVDEFVVTRLLRNKRSKGVEITATRVVLGSTVDALGEPLEGGEALDAEAGAELAVGIGVNLGDQNLVVLASKSASKLFVDLNRMSFFLVSQVC